jgi:hypothetical protein
MLERPSVDPALEPLVKELLAVTGARDRVANVMRTILGFENFTSPAGIPAEEATFDENMTGALNRAAKTQNEKYKRLADLTLKDANLDEAAWYVYAPLYGDGWTADELKEIIAFYRSPIGKKMIARDPMFHLWEQIRTLEFFGTPLYDSRKKIEREELLKTNPARVTADDMRLFAVALDQYAYEHDELYPSETDPKVVQKLIAPPEYSYLDVWGTPLRISYSPDRRHYRLQSAGSDKTFAPYDQPWGASPRIDRTPGADVVYEDGVFRSYPPGATDQKM